MIGPNLPDPHNTLQSTKTLLYTSSCNLLNIKLRDSTVSGKSILWHMPHRFTRYLATLLSLFELPLLDTYAPSPDQLLVNNIYHLYHRTLPRQYTRISIDVFPYIYTWNIACLIFFVFLIYVKILLKTSRILTNTHRC